MKQPTWRHRGRGATVSKIAAELRRMIFTGVLNDGEKLVQEKLAEQLGVSRVPLREAFGELAAEGLITLRSNKGAVVRGISSDEITQLMEMRAQLEIFLLRIAFSKATEADLEAAEAALAASEAAHPDRWSATNLAFHAKLYEPAQKPLIIDEIERLYWRTYERVQHLFVGGGNREQSQLEHRTLIDYARRSDTEPAVRLLEHHVMFNLQVVVEGLNARKKDRPARS